MTNDPSSVEPSSNEPDLETLLNSLTGQTRSVTAPLLLILVFIILALAAWLFYPFFQPAVKPTETVSSNLIAGVTLGTQFTQSQGNLYYVDRPSGFETTDIFARPITATTPITPQNLTLSPNYSEFQPTLDPHGEQLAFFSVSRTGDKSLQVMRPGHVALNITYHSGASGLSDDCQIEFDTPPQWDPESHWLAFLVKCTPENGQMTKLFVASAAGGQVKAISQSGYPIARVSWQDAQTLIYSEQRPDHSEAIYQVLVISPVPQPTLISTVVATN